MTQNMSYGYYCLECCPRYWESDGLIINVNNRGPIQKCPDHWDVADVEFLRKPTVWRSGTDPAGVVRPIDDFVMWVHQVRHEAEVE